MKPAHTMGFQNIIKHPIFMFIVFGILVLSVNCYFNAPSMTPGNCAKCTKALITDAFSCLGDVLIALCNWVGSFFFSTSGHLPLSKKGCGDLAIPKPEPLTRDEFHAFLKPEDQVLWTSFLHRAYVGCVSDENWSPCQGNCLQFPNLASSGMGGKVIWARKYVVGRTGGSIGSDPAAGISIQSKGGKSLVTELQILSSLKPDAILTNAVDPGQAWAFAGQGEVLIKLAFPVWFLGATIHHPPKWALPSGFFQSAPREIEFFGIRNEGEEPFSFGRFNYSDQGLSAQTFVPKVYWSQQFGFIKMMIISNYGNPKFTTLYRVEVHGFPAYTAPWFAE